MKSNFKLAGALGAIGLAAGLMGAPSVAQAGGNVHWSVGFSNGFPVYGAPAPIYVQPRPVYVQPHPIYVQPRPIYVQPRPIYAPPPVYYGAPPLLVRPQPVYPIGWRPHGHWRHPHHYRQGPRWGY